ncbi:uncharacterized protein IWZ02DRAFT_36179 [Phyllosticta citriasiana]|uniref:uncharacterized protein n=1 Tax=Phyllosticta citriasiana TaxID=595635 RepID=UPI0030FD8C4A
MRAFCLFSTVAEFLLQCLSRLHSSIHAPSSLSSLLYLASVAETLSTHVQYSTNMYISTTSTRPRKQNVKATSVLCISRAY